MRFEECAANCAAATARRIERERQLVAEVPERQVRSLFAGAATTRLNLDWITSCLPANEELRWDLRTLRARARETMRNNAIAEGYFGMLETDVIGPDDVRLEMQLTNRLGKPVKEVNDAIEEAWERYCLDPTVEGEISGVANACLNLRTTACDGEVLVHKRIGYDNEWGFAIQSIDVDLLSEWRNQDARGGQPEIVMSVARDRDGRRLGYWIDTQLSVLGTSTSGAPRFVPADEILHLGRSQRIGQVRYATWLAPVLDDLHMLQGYLEAAVVAARTAAAIPGVFQRRTDTENPLGTKKLNQPVTVEGNAGTFLVGPDGYEAAQWRPDHPKAELPAYVNECIRRIATGLHVSHYRLANNVENFSYSSGRIQLIPERDEWKKLQRFMVDRYYRPIFETWLTCALAKGAINLRVSDPRILFAAATWHPRRWPWVDPRADMQANRDGIELLLTTPQDIVADQGGDWDEVLAKQAKARKAAAAAGVPFPAPQGAAPAAPRQDPAPPAGAAEGGSTAADGGAAD